MAVAPDSGPAPALERERNPETVSKHAETRRRSIPVTAEGLLALVAGLGEGPALLVQGPTGREPELLLAASGDARRLLGWPAAPAGDAPPETLARLPVACELLALVQAAGGARGAPVARLVPLDGQPRRARASSVRSGDQVITAVVFAPAAGESPVLVPDAERHQRYAQLSGAGDLAAKLNHNLRNPLASVVAGLSILELSVTLAPEDQQLAATVQSDVGRVTERVREVLDRVRLPPLQPCLVPLGSLVDRLRVVLPDLASEHRVSLRITADDEALLLLLDLPLMERAVLDLVRNAAQAAGDGGQVEVRCERPAPERLARRFPRFVGRVVTLVVDDSGPGIPPERRLEVVRPFVTTRRASAGLGLTLAACAVERHGGSLEISESPLGGARLEVHLPLAPREAVDCELDCWPQELSACAVDVVSRHLLCWSTRGGHFAQTGEVHDGCRQCWVYRSTALHAGAGSA